MKIVKKFPPGVYYIAVPTRGVLSSHDHGEWKNGRYIVRRWLKIRGGVEVCKSEK